MIHFNGELKFIQRYRQKKNIHVYSSRNTNNSWGERCNEVFVDLYPKFENESKYVNFGVLCIQSVAKLHRKIQGDNWHQEYIPIENGVANQLFRQKYRVFHPN